MRLFEFRDKSGRLIYLTAERWRHITMRHPEMVNQMLQIEETLQRPLAVLRATSDPDARLYYRYYKVNAAEPYLLVMVKYLNGTGFIITSFYTDDMNYGT